MRVKCIRQRLSEEQVAALGTRYYRPQSFHLTVGKEYLVIGLDLAIGSNVHGTGIWVHMVSDQGDLVWAPLMLFEVTDPRVSKYWQVRTFEKGLKLWPAALFKDSFHEDLADGVPAAEAEFRDVRSRLEQEAHGQE